VAAKSAESSPAPQIALNKHIFDAANYFRRIIREITHVQSASKGWGVKNPQTGALPKLVGK